MGFHEKAVSLRGPPFMKIFQVRNVLAARDYSVKDSLIKRFRFVVTIRDVVLIPQLQTIN